MGWLNRLFGPATNRNAGHNDAPARQAPASTQQAPAQQVNSAPQQTIPPERVGLNGEYDQSGLAKRVAKAFDDQLANDIDTVYIAQTGSTVVLKGKVPDQGTLNQLVNIARSVRGTSNVDTSQVTTG